MSEVRSASVLCAYSMHLASHERDDVLLNENSTAYIKVHVICEAQQWQTAQVYVLSGEKTLELTFILQ